jgi:hypothetical protein
VDASPLARVTDRSRAAADEGSWAAAATLAPVTAHAFRFTATGRA